MLVISSSSVASGTWFKIDGKKYSFSFSGTPGGVERGRDTEVNHQLKEFIRSDITITAFPITLANAAAVKMPRSQRNQLL